MARGLDGEEKAIKAHSVLLRLVLPPYTIHFKSSTYMREGTLDLLDRKVCKETLKSTANNALVREAIGTDGKFWSELVMLFKAAIPSLERRSFTIWDPTSVDYESTSGALIASHYPGLWKDVERLNDLVSISRNVLTIGAPAQDLACIEGVDNDLFRLVNCCVRVTARGYDGEAGTGDEEKWQWIVNAYKKLLITSLQFLNNLVAQNEKRKLLLWLSLFDHETTPEAYSASFAAEDIPETSRTSLADVPSNPPIPPQPPVLEDDILLAYGTDGSRWITQDEHDMAVQTVEHKDKLPPAMRAAVEAARKGDASGLVPNAYVFYGKTPHVRARRFEFYQDDFKRDPTLAEEHQELMRQWGEVTQRRETEDYWEGLYADAAAKYRADAAVWEAKQIATRTMMEQDGMGAAASERERELRNRVQELEAEIAEHLQMGRGEAEAMAREIEVEIPSSPPHLTGVLDHSDLQHRATLPDDMKMMFTADAGSRILESGKIELMKRLSDYSPPDPNLPPSRHPDGLTTRPCHRDPQGRPLERTRSMSRSPVIVQYCRNGPRNKGEVEAWVRLNEGRRREDMIALPLPEEGMEELNLPRPEYQMGGGVAVPEQQQQGLRRGSRAARGREEAEGEDPEGSEPREEGEVDEEEEEDDEEEEEEDDDEDYPGSTEDGRGLLTDVPLILGPSEIEVLPMLIMSGIVPPNTPPRDQPSPAKDADPNDTPFPTSALSLQNLHTTRTHLLLSQSTGRNLLRELLIFVAAWDLREEELYFKFMVKIMEAILNAGLMPYAYHAFRDRSRSKDIISPAQAVIMKLMTVVYRGRGSIGGDQSTADEAELNAARLRLAKSTPEADARSYTLHSRRRALLTVYPPPTRTDLHTLNFLFTEFRQHIIPQTCALIFLQSQIHVGRASPEDFPLNLWDMERMYEGVYQFLEFFAVVCEEGGAAGVGNVHNLSTNGAVNGPGGVTGGGGWGKGVLSEWEASCELVALLRELEGGTEKRDGIVQLRYGKGAAIGAPPLPSLPHVASVASNGRRVSGQASVGAQSAAGGSLPGVGVPAPVAGLMQQRSLSADAAIPAVQTLLPGLQAGQQQLQRAMDAEALVFDGEQSAAPGFPPTLPSLPSTLLPPASTNGQPIFEPETPLAYPEDMQAQAAQVAAAQAHAAQLGGVPLPPQPPPPLDQDEPSDFEWRNLKKLTVLVLSSLIWKNPQVQNQVRRYGGLEALVSCCRHDESNPYIREHAIMCLRFAVEGNEENGEVVRGLAGAEVQRDRKRVRSGGEEREALRGGRVTLDEGFEDGGDGREEVVREVLEMGGYETFLDGRGLVGLRKREGTTASAGGAATSAVAPPAPAIPNAVASSSSKATMGQALLPPPSSSPMPSISSHLGLS
ncbi:hypothetical protein LTR78_001923 [Recurvomyces mirabilis]|uniref:Ataxin-10 homolog n=1 Tax=Recurvomyces mirabilis TaxID=574656 RepID=A0AAE0WW70_9PEZI|nr:hypothetical protein LTR78_001923 [Recurvomyces mirabilis]KAK5156638.1 hypothetical protein LTS14_004850 [Recurvomyces mirabilis]